MDVKIDSFLTYFVVFQLFPREKYPLMYLGR